MNTLFKNQGVYNGLIGVLILIAIFVVPSITWLVLLMAYIILVELYGSLTSDKMILLKQGGLAIFNINIIIILRKKESKL